MDGKGKTIHLDFNNPDIGLRLELSAITLSLEQSDHNYLLMSDGMPGAPGDLGHSCECSVLQKIRSSVLLGVRRARSSYG